MQGRTLSISRRGKGQEGEVGEGRGREGHKKGKEIERKEEREAGEGDKGWGRPR